MSDRAFNGSNVSLQIVKTEIAPTGESLQIVRPVVTTTKSSDQIVDELVQKFDYKTNEVKETTGGELNAVQQAFGQNLAEELIKTYDGSNLVSDSQQDLIGEKYLAEQIKIIQEQQKTTSILDKWSHLLYEGEKEEKAEELSSAELEENENENDRENEDEEAVEYEQEQKEQNETTERSEKEENEQEQDEEQDEEQEDEEKEDEEEEQEGEEEQSPSVYTTNTQPNESINTQYSYAIKPTENQAPSQLRLSQSGNLVTTANQEETEAEQQDDEQEQEQPHRTLDESTNDYATELIENKTHSQSQMGLEPRSMSDFKIKPKGKLETEFRGTESRIRTDARGGAGPSQSSFHHSRSNHQHHGWSGQQSASYMPQFSSSNLNSVTIDAYNSPQFKAMLDQLTKPLNVPPEHVNFPPEWPSQDKINFLAEPIYIPAPQPIVIPAPNIINLNQESASYPRHNIDESALKPTVSYYPTIASDQALMKNFGIRQLNLDAHLARTGSNIHYPRQNY